MARLTRTPRNAGVYDAVRLAHEREIADSQPNRVPPSPGVVQRLELMRIGKTIDTPAEYQPNDVRPQLIAGAPGVRARVKPDGAATLRAEAARESLAENGHL